MSYRVIKAFSCILFILAFNMYNKIGDMNKNILKKHLKRMKDKRIFAKSDKYKCSARRNISKL